MSNPNKRRGTQWETEIVRFLREQLPDLYVVEPGQHAPGVSDIRRVAQTGRLDTGDIHADPVVIEAKNVQKIDLAGFVEQAEREAVNAGMDYGVAVVKRRGKGAAHGYVVLTLATFAAMLAEIRVGRANTRAGRES